MPIVVVNLKLKMEAEGGRHGPISEGFSPHLEVDGSSEMLGVRVVECPEWIYPGAQALVNFSLIYFPSVDYSSLKVGTSVSIVEGPNNIGSGVILEVHN